MEPNDVNPVLVQEELARVSAMEEFEVYAASHQFQVYDIRKGRYGRAEMIIDADFYNTLWENMVHGLGLCGGMGADKPLSQYLQEYLEKNPVEAKQ